MSLIVPGAPLLVLLSGGGDSVCLLDVALRAGARVSALHVNYGLREGGRKRAVRAARAARRAAADAAEAAGRRPATN